MDSKMTEQDIEKTEEEDFGIEEIDLYQTYKKPKKAEEPKQEEDEPVNIWREIGSFVGPFVLAFLVAFFLKEYIPICPLPFKAKMMVSNKKGAPFLGTPF